MSRFRVQRFITSVTVPLNNDTADAPIIGATSGNNQLNGILKGITLVAPALTGTAYTLWVLGQRGETLFTKTAVVENTTTHINVDANNRPLEIPIALQGVSPFRIKSTGTPDATGVLTLVGDSSVILDGETVSIGGQVYRFKDTTAAINDVKIIPHVAASAVLTWDNAVNVTDGSLVVAGSVTYTAKTALTDGIIANEVLIGADGDAFLLNLKKAINAEAGGGTAYGSATVINPDVSSSAVAAHAITLTAKVAGTVGNALAKSENDAHLDYDGAGATFTGGTDNGFESLENLELAINANGTGDGTDYHAGTVANAYVTASRTNGVLTVTAVEAVDDPADVATTETSGVLSWGAVTLAGGGEAGARVFDVDLLIDRG